MPIVSLHNDEVFGLVRPSVDAHTLGIAGLAELLEKCGYRAVIADADTCAIVDAISTLGNAQRIALWVRENRITRLGYSNRLDPRQAQLNFGKLLYHLGEVQLLARAGGPLRAVYFAGLPQTCRAIGDEYKGAVETFSGEGTPRDTLVRMGVPPHRFSEEVTAGSAYDDARMNFARKLIEDGSYLKLGPKSRGGYPTFNTGEDTVVARLEFERKRGGEPLMRAHVGPYHPDRSEALRMYNNWVRELAVAGQLDVLSIGSSQLTQSDFGQDWTGKSNGGGVPVNSPQEYAAIRDAARPMFVRTYAGTTNIPEMAVIHEQTLNIAWHALSFWWFCQIDGRGPHMVKENLRQHCDTLRYIAATGKPFEPNIPHHFSFRGGDDVTYVLSALLAAKTAKSHGVRHFILQTMLNTPRNTWGVQDLAKARTLLRLIRELEDESFRVYLQPRAGLDYFSTDLLEARVQLAAVTALIDDIEPHESSSPSIIHVVSYSEAVELATPAVVNESIQITRHALKEYRRLRTDRKIEDMSVYPDILQREQHLVEEVRTLVYAIETALPNPYTPEGLYLIFAAGFLPVPYLWECREEFRHAIAWRTAMRKGGVCVVNENGTTVPAVKRAGRALDNLATLRRM
jgi:hypothetical protein